MSSSGEDAKLFNPGHLPPELAHVVFSIQDSGKHATEGSIVGLIQLSL
jgi:hypothetical protein